MDFFPINRSRLRTAQAESPAKNLLMRVDLVQTEIFTGKNCKLHTRSGFHEKNSGGLTYVRAPVESLVF